MSITWKGSLAQAPENPELCWAYFNTGDGCSYIYDGTQWTLLAAKGDKGDPDFTVKYVVTFNTKGGSDIDSVSVAAGCSVGRPADPSFGPRIFCGWYTDNSCETAYDFTAAVTADITLYAKWESTVYKLVARHGVDEGQYTYDKFVLKFGNELVNAGDILSFRFRSTTEIDYMSIRGQNDKWVYEDKTSTHGMTTYETKEDGWTYVTYVFSGRNYNDTADMPADAWFRIDFGSDTIVVGEILEILGVTLNGRILTLTSSNLTESVNPTVETIEPYEWTSHNVTFDIGYDSLTSVKNVQFGKRVAAPELDARDGYLFIGWFADSSYTTPFDLDLLITEDATVYGKWGAKKTVTFNTNGGSEIAAVVVPAGTSFARPADPTKDGFTFFGWYVDEGFSTGYDFSSLVYADITLYAKWINPKHVTLDYNYDGGPADTILEVEGGTTINQPANPSRVGYFFGGWTTDDEGNNAYDFSTAVSADITLYAKWIAPTKAYKFTATVAHGRFQYRLRESVDTALASIQPGDVFTMQVKFTSSTATPSGYRIRTRDGEKNITADSQALPEPDGNGWYSITFTAPDNGGEYIGKGGLYIAFFANGTWEVGDVCIIKALAYNGHELVLRTGEWADNSSVRDFGAYDAVKPNSEEIAP